MNRSLFMEPDSLWMCSPALEKSQVASWLKWCSKCHPWFMAFISISALGGEGSQSCSNLWAHHKHWRGEIQVGRMLKAVLGGKFQNSQLVGKQQFLRRWAVATSSCLHVESDELLSLKQVLEGAWGPGPEPSWASWWNVAEVTPQTNFSHI